MTVGAQNDVDEKVPLKKVKTIEWKKVEKCFLCENLEIFYSNNSIIYLSCVKLIFLSFRTHLVCFPTGIAINVPLKQSQAIVIKSKA